MDPQIVSVGITEMSGGHGLLVVRQRSAGVRALYELGPATLRLGVRGMPVRLCETTAPLRPQVLLPASDLSPSESQRMLPEQGIHRPLRPGLQLQNWDSDKRLGLLDAAQIEVGSLGMMIDDRRGPLLLSNNHVLAAQNRAELGDRIVQAGGGDLDEDDVIARLERFVALCPSEAGAHLRWGNVVFNRVDAAIARVAPGVAWRPDYLPYHRLPALRRRSNPRLGDEVFKVGRTTGLRRGRIVSVANRVGPIPYAVGDCWFRGSFMIESLDGRSFSDGGDSGAVVVRGDGEVLGLVFAGNGEQTFACPIADVVDELGL